MSTLPTWMFSPGSCGPAAADEMMGRDGHHWRELVPG
jgi:hypothetical protein